jgi:tRNA pseudouridine38-40 synthase
VTQNTAEQVTQNTAEQVTTWMPRYRLIVAYEGTAFHGWQKQTGPDGAPLRTVQLVLEEAVRRVAHEDVEVNGASRTDSGVHARGQVAAFTCQAELPAPRLAAAITSRLPHDVKVRGAAVVDPDFSPSSSSLAKCYRYRLVHGCLTAARRPLFGRQYVAATVHRLDVPRMNLAARMLLGRHDFASFTRVHHGRLTTVRTIHECLVKVTGPRRCVVEIVGDGFLYNMVRIIAGTLIEVGRGRIDPLRMSEILAARDRAAAGPTAPPQGLCLEWIRYD